MEQLGQTGFVGKFPTPEIRRVPLLVLRQKSRGAQFLALARPWHGAQQGYDNIRFVRTNGDSTLVTITIGKREDQIRLGDTVEYIRDGAKPISIVLRKSGLK